MWTEDALQAETAQYEGRLDEAERAYERLLPDAPNADKRRWLLVNHGRVALERGDVDEARQRFAVVYEDPRKDLHGANALYEVAKLAPPEQAVAQRLRVIERYPDQVAAEFALQDIIGLHRAADDFVGLRDLLVRLCDELADTELGDNAWFQLALVLQSELNDPDAALDAYRELFQRYPKGPLADDALWEMSNIYRAHQLWEPAITLMTKLANEQEESWFIGSYNSDWVDDAMYDIGWVKLVYQSDYDGATRWFKRYLKDFPDGLLNDDAAWNIVEARRLRGDEAGYRTGLREFVDEYPESRYVRVATVRLQEAS